MGLGAPFSMAARCARPSETGEKWPLHGVLLEIRNGNVGASGIR